MTIYYYFTIFVPFQKKNVKSVVFFFYQKVKMLSKKINNQKQRQRQLYFPLVFSELVFLVISWVIAMWQKYFYLNRIKMRHWLNHFLVHFFKENMTKDTYFVYKILTCLKNCNIGFLCSKTYFYEMHFEFSFMQSVKTLVFCSSCREHSNDTARNAVNISLSKQSFFLPFI